MLKKVWTLLLGVFFCDLFYYTVQIYLLMILHGIWDCCCTSIEPLKISVLMNTTMIHYSTSCDPETKIL